ncbi:UHRF1-binding 1-like isoform X3 [Brachionus plicatilis]|uniref:UHRF1-binding 1-like isoform X3 n=1 Tax=Brachionus plicatilis TaxID=10195 RepID=A0A3M7PHC9_BRAPC|nr:UHRF1-binding 1-like isoform X3 [Brachionus plicatilis]
MNPSKIRIVLKKKLSDKSLINSTIRILLNEIYWMASDTQLKAAIGTYKTLSKLMTKSFEQKKKYVQIQQRQNKSNSPVKNLNTSEKTSNEILSKYDIKETSIHLQISNLNIHLYADDNYSDCLSY